MITNFLSKSLKSFGHVVFISISIMAIFIQKFDDKGNIYSNLVNYIISFENRFYDFRLTKNLDKTPPSNEISLVEIDDYSLNQIGLWPIPRTLHAQLVDKLQVYGAKVIAMDIMFPEKSANSCGNSSPDEELIKAFRRFNSVPGNKVYFGYGLTDNKNDALLSAPIEITNDIITVPPIEGNNSSLHPVMIGKYTFPNEIFLNSGAGFANIGSEEDPDGVFRSSYLVFNVEDSELGTLSLGSLGYFAWDAYISKESRQSAIIEVKESGSTIILDKSKIEIYRDGKTKVRYIGGLEKFSTAPFYDVINADNNDPEMIRKFRNKIVYVGSTAVGAHDLRSSPIDPKMPGVLSHMNITNMLLKKYFFKPNDDSIQVSLIILALGLIIFFLAQLLDSALIDIVLVNVLLFGTYYIEQYYFFPKGYEIKLVSCFYCFISCYSWNTFFKFSEASKEKKQIKGTFARYVAPTIVEEMLKDPSKLHVGGTKKDITCLFSDVRDFTSISEGLSATELAHSLNMYMGSMTDIVLESKGTLDKYIGDAIVAIWGAPLEIGNHAQFAVEGAITMMNTLPAINEEFKKLGRPEFNVGIGLNSGECNVGNMGSERIFSYTALGDNMNLGARLESLCKYYGTQILISEYTLERLNLTHIKYRPIDKVIVKGKTTPVAIFEVLHSWHPMTLDPKIHEFYMSAWNLFLAKNFSGAMSIFDEILKTFDDKSTKRLRDLCDKYIKQPEMVNEQFDVTKMTEK